MLLSLTPRRVTVSLHVAVSPTPPRERGAILAGPFAASLLPAAAAAALPMVTEVRPWGLVLVAAAAAAAATEAAFAVAVLTVRLLVYARSASPGPTSIGWKPSYRATATLHTRCTRQFVGMMH